MATLKVPVTSHDHIQGDLNAPIVLVEYGDYECPHCASAYPIAKRVKERFGERLAFVFRNFPLNQAHPSAEIAAEAAEFAARHGRFWEMHDAIYENQEALGKPLLLELAQSLGLSSSTLDVALTNHEYAARVKEDFVGGVRSGVNGTPTFFINGHRHDDSFEFDVLAAAIEAQVSNTE
ncbi:MAG TPA: thioredoxin domain-containing protein [Tepidisphaeraceae bacterium]|jgi:protein-disulfide isomerase|nr:thioredoxin domain-containing protein [Tepidisphaeraceae bacterium]